MARALSSRRRRQAADEWADTRGGGDEERQVLSNSQARADAIRMAVRELARMEAERKAISAEIAEFKVTHIKGDLGFRVSDFNAIYRVSQLETEDRDTLLDTLREGWEALGIGGTLDWVAAANELGHDAGERERHAAANGEDVDSAGHPMAAGFERPKRGRGRPRKTPRLEDAGAEV